MRKQSDTVMYGFTQTSPLLAKKTVGIFLVVIVLGIGTGYLLAQQKGGQGTKMNEQALSGNVVSGTIVGSEDTKTFKDIAEGELQEGGIADEGQFHLVRPGGESQNVYLTSSHVDLSIFVNRNVKVWGQTQKAEKAGWLMDVGRVEVLQ